MRLIKQSSKHSVAHMRMAKICMSIPEFIKQSSAKPPDKLNSALVNSVRAGKNTNTIRHDHWNWITSELEIIENSKSFKGLELL